MADFQDLDTVTQNLSGPDREVLSELLVNNARRFQSLAPAVSDWYERAADVIRTLHNDIAADQADLAYALACDRDSPALRVRGFDPNSPRREKAPRPTAATIEPRPNWPGLDRCAEHQTAGATGWEPSP